MKRMTSGGLLRRAGRPLGYRLTRDPMCEAGNPRFFALPSLRRLAPSEVVNALIQCLSELQPVLWTPILLPCCLGRSVGNGRGAWKARSRKLGSHNALRDLASTGYFAAGFATRSLHDAHMFLCVPAFAARMTSK